MPEPLPATVAHDPVYHAALADYEARRAHLEDQLDDVSHLDEQLRDLRDSVVRDWSEAANWRELADRLKQYFAWEDDPANAPSDADAHADPEELADAVLGRSDAEAAACRPGDRLGEFTIVRQLSNAGGFGQVYLAKQQSTGQEVVVKVLRPDAALSPALRLRFLAEIRRTAGLKHPHIVHVLTGGIARGRLYYAMEYLCGGTLGERMAPYAAEPRRAAALLRDVAATAGYQHTQGIIHRDLKPSNILFDAEGDAGQPRIADYGLAGSSTAVSVAGTMEAPQGEASWPRTVGILGTPGYMAPEQTNIRQPVTPAADVYALGVILFELLTGRLPFSPGTHVAPQTPKWDGARADRELHAIGERCLHFEPERRYPTGNELARDLAHWLAHEPLDAATIPTPRTRRVAKWTRRNPLGTATIAATILLLVGAVGFSIFAVDARNQEHLLRQAAESSEEQAKRDQQRAEKARGRAEASERARDAALEDLLTAAQETHLAAAMSLLAQRRHRDAVNTLGDVPAVRQEFSFFRLLLECQRAPRPVDVLAVHDWGVSALLVARDGRLLTAGFDGRLLLWEPGVVAPRELIVGTAAVSAGLWKLAADCRPGVTLLDAVMRLAWVKDGAEAVAVTHQGAAVLWVLSRGESKVVWTHPRQRPLRAVAVAAGGALLFGDEEGSVWLRGPGEAAVRPRSLAPSPLVYLAAVAPDRWLAVQEDGTLTLLTPDLATVLAQTREAGPLWDAALAPDGMTIAVCGPRLRLLAVDGRAGTLRPPDPPEAYDLPVDEGAPARAFQCAGFSPDGKRLFAADDQSRVLAWDRPGPSPRFVSARRADFMHRNFAGELARGMPRPWQRPVTCIDFLPTGQTLLTAGQTTTVERWVTEDSRAARTFTVGKEPRTWPDPDDGDLLWVGDEAGNLEVWDLSLGKRRSRPTPAHTGSVVGLQVSASGLVVSAGTDRRLRFWQRRGDEIQPAAPTELAHDESIRTAALSPPGDRVAVYDATDRVVAWELPSGRKIGVIQDRVPGLKPALVGPLAFSPDGRRLAVGGQWQHFAVYNLAEPDEPPVRTPNPFSGDGGMALAWHPTRPGLLLAGDSLGRITTHPLAFTEGLRWTHGSRHSTEPLVGLAIAPDGATMAALGRSGDVRLQCPQWIGQTCVLPATGARPTSVHFDAAGSRLVVSHGDGTIACWDTVLPSRPGRRGERWTMRELASGEQAREWDTRSQALALDPEGRLRVLFSRRASQAEGGNRLIALGTVTENGWEEQVLERLDDKQSAVRLDDLKNTLTLVNEGDQLSATFRRPRPDLGLSAAELVVFDPDLQPPLSGALVSTPGNLGFSPHLPPTAAGTRQALHFSHGGHRLLSTSWEGKESRTVPLGRMGDGYSLWGKTDPQGHTHLVFRPLRFNGDRHPLTYVRVTGAPPRMDRRETVDVTARAGVEGLELGPDGEPVVAYARQSTAGTYELVLSRRTERGWVRSVVLNGLPGAFGWGMSRGRDGKLCLAVLDHRYRLVLAEEDATGWKTSWIADAPPTTGYRSTFTSAAVARDGRGRLLVLAWRSNAEGGWVRLYRRDDPPAPEQP